MIARLLHFFMNNFVRAVAALSFTLSVNKCVFSAIIYAFCLLVNIPNTVLNQPLNNFSHTTFCHFTRFRAGRGLFSTTFFKGNCLVL